MKQLQNISTGLNVPFIYRIHEDPKPEKLQRFFEFITNFGYIVRGTANDVHPRALQEIIEAIEGKPEETVISTVMLRSMQQAKYDPESLGHFGFQLSFIRISHRQSVVIRI